MSAGWSVSAIDQIYNNGWKKVFWINRPAGHHAGINSIGGFCYFNNVAIAAKYAKKSYGVKKIAIIDWDVHYGNGTS